MRLSVVFPVHSTIRLQDPLSTLSTHRELQVHFLREFISVRSKPTDLWKHILEPSEEPEPRAIQSEDSGSIESRSLET